MKLCKMSKKKQNCISLNKNKDFISAVMFIGPSLAGVLIFVLIPFVDVVKKSFFEAMGGKFTGIKNYVNVFGNEAFLLASFNTLKFIAVCIPILLVMSLAVAVILNVGNKSKDLFKTTFLMPMAVPVASVVVLWKVMFDENGLISKLLVSTGGTSINWMNTDLSFWVLIITYLWKNIGYDVILWLAGLSNIQDSLYEAARMDGANSMQCFLNITLPGLMPAVFMIAVLSLLNSFKVFREAYLIAGNYPHTSMYLLQHLFNNWFTDLDIDKLCAGAVIMAAVIFVLILIFQKAWGDEDV